ncbi:hypothetical protein R3P38DRAFT_2780292 [Favolaschia claudopus]|uniref:Uncharacterized protein n=1 Tax=Favolaschia claudopus TaxID=2862362 RepID=A0AAW0B7R3_9AGAR
MGTKHLEEHCRRHPKLCLPFQLEEVDIPLAMIDCLPQHPSSAVQLAQSVLQNLEAATLWVPSGTTDDNKIAAAFILSFMDGTSRIDSELVFFRAATSEPVHSTLMKPTMVSPGSKAGGIVYPIVVRREFKRSIPPAAPTTGSADTAFSKMLERSISSQDSSAEVKICTKDATSPGCADVPFTSGRCINLDGGLSFFYKQISAVVVPGGHARTFYQDYECQAPSGHLNSATDGEVYLAAGTWIMNAVPSLDGTVDFNDLTSSFTCSRI